MAEETEETPVVSGATVETVDDNDNADNDDTAAVAAATMSAEDKARVAAEARRKRIQEKAFKRLAVVSGEQALDEEEKKASAANAARLKAARQRRYGKKSTPTTTEATAGSAAAAPADAPVDEATPAAVSETTAVVEDTTKPAVPDVVSTAATTAEPDASDVVTPAAEATAVPPANKKKYHGVAKTRRQMLAKKKAQETEQDSTTVGGGGGAPVGGGAKATAKAGPPVPAAALLTKKVAIVPIYMHIVTIILIFLAGLDVGLQQFVDDDMQIHSQTALKQYGLPFLHRSPFEPLTPVDENAAGTKRYLEGEYLSGATGQSDNLDEFQVEEEEYVPIVDPLFRVDLDEMTKGPGFLNQLARGAVFVHRVILWLIYLAPVAFVTKLLSVPMSLWQSPPTLFLTALALRQVVGKAILGARLPDPSEQAEDGVKNNLDVLNIAKNFVKNFFTTSFPTAVTLYDAFSHLRSDMYVAICGVFVGMAWTHLQGDTMPLAKELIDSVGGDEL